MEEAFELEEDAFQVFTRKMSSSITQKLFVGEEKRVDLDFVKLLNFFGGSVCLNKTLIIRVKKAY